MFYAHLKTKAKLRSLNVHNKNMDNCCLTVLEHKYFSENVTLKVNNT
jgi:hypothetical protein